MGDITYKDVGNVTIKYRESDWSLKKDKQFTFKTMTILTIMTLGLMAFIIFLATVLESILPFALLIILLIAAIMFFIFIIAFYCIRIAYKKQIPAFSTISWLCRAYDIEAGYFNDRLLFLFKGGQTTVKSIKGILYDIGIEGEVHHNANKLEPIRVIFNFTEPNRYDVYVVNEIPNKRG